MQISRLFTSEVQSMIALTCLAICSSSELPGWAKSATTKSSDGVVVKKNADGTVEAYDAGSSPQPLGQSGGSVSRRAHAPRAYSRTIGGVHVKKNADGTVETYESSPAVYHSIRSGGGRSSKSSRHRGGTHTSSSGDVKVKRNADGTVETSDN